MRNLLIYPAVAAALCAVSGVFSTSAAQTGGDSPALKNSQLLAPGASVETVSAADINTVLGRLGAQTIVFDDENPVLYTIAATLESGGTFMVSLSDCLNADTGADCRRVTTYTGMPNAGFSYETLNLFNTLSGSGKAINLAEQNAIVFGTHQFLAGGVSLSNIEFNMVQLLSDVSQFVTALEGEANTVSFNGRAIAPAGDKTANVTGDAPSSATLTPDRAGGAYSTRAAVAAAIGNTVNTSFRIAD